MKCTKMDLFIKQNEVGYQHAVDITSATIYIGRPIIVKANKSV